MTEREAARCLYVALKMQAELLEALLTEGSLSPERARPMIAQIAITAGAWRHRFEEGPDTLSESLQWLEERVRVPGAEFPPPRP